MSARVTEEEVARNVSADLKAEGFDVFINPQQPVVPAFLGDYTPDMIALREDKKLVVEILSEGDRGKQRAESLQKLVKDHEGWDLRVVWISPASTTSSPPKQSDASIKKALAEIDKLFAAGFMGPTVLTCWAVIEALSRRLFAKEMAKPQTPGRVVEFLARDGHITPDEADLFRSMAKVRNAFVHGALDTKISKVDVRKFVKAVNSLQTASPD